jgi:hypothetical protein
MSWMTWLYRYTVSSPYFSAGPMQEESTEKCAANNKPQLQRPFDEALRYNGQDTIVKQVIHAVLRTRHHCTRLVSYTNKGSNPALWPFRYPCCYYYSTFGGCNDRDMIGHTSSRSRHFQVQSSLVPPPNTFVELVILIPLIPFFDYISLIPATKYALVALPAPTDSWPKILAIVALEHADMQGRAILLATQHA